MADTEPTTIATYLTAGGVLGGILAKAVVALWKWANKGNDALIVELRANNAVLSAEKARLEAVIDTLGKKYDAERDKREKTELMFAAHVVKTDDYEDLPSKVQTIALTVDPTKLAPRG